MHPASPLEISCEIFTSNAHYLMYLESRLKPSRYCLSLYDSATKTSRGRAFVSARLTLPFPVVMLFRSKRERNSSSRKEEGSAAVMPKIRNGTFAKASSESRAFSSSLGPKNSSLFLVLAFTMYTTASIYRTKIEMY